MHTRIVKRECPKCHHNRMFVPRSYGALWKFKCSKCGHTEKR